jgi:hypothetical protein
VGQKNERDHIPRHAGKAPNCTAFPVARQELREQVGRAWEPSRPRLVQGNVAEQSLWPMALPDQRLWLADRPMGGDIGVARRSSASWAAVGVASVGVATAGSVLGSGRRSTGLSFESVYPGGDVFLPGWSPAAVLGSQPVGKQEMGGSRCREVLDFNLTRGSSLTTLGSHSVGLSRHLDGPKKGHG